MPEEVFEKVKDEIPSNVGVFVQLSVIMTVTPYDKKNAEVIEEIRYIEILMRAFKYLLQKDYWNCCHELSDLFELEPVFQPHIAYATQKLLEMAVN